MIQVTSPVIANIEIIPASHLVWLESSSIAATARPGQFVMVHCGQNRLLRRPMSVHQVDGSKFALLFCIVGKGTRWLSRRQAGDRLDIFGPLGNGYKIYPKSKNLLLVAGGMGIAPLRFLAEDASKQGKKVTLILGARSAMSLLPVIPLPHGASFTEEAPVSINVLNATEDGSEGFKGMATELIPSYVDQADQVFACGPVNMYQAIAKLSQKHQKLKSAQVSLEIMMGCGMGICYGCTIKTKSGLKQVCTDGPVFELSDLVDINWDELNNIYHFPG